ncbi:hypothetical protein QL285_028168 [Trifolium repens]|nr:hypothetical protein QL285_028168 [Trifolium repens]
MGGSIYSFRNGPQQGHRSAMESSCCDVKIKFIIITDLVHFISLGAKVCHRAAMCYIVLRWTDFLQIYFFGFLGKQAAPIVTRSWETSCRDGMLIFFTFWAFSCLLASWTLS